MIDLKEAKNLLDSLSPCDGIPTYEIIRKLGKNLYDKLQTLRELVKKCQSIAKEILSWDYRCFTKDNDELQWFLDARDLINQMSEELRTKIAELEKDVPERKEKK